MCDFAVTDEALRPERLGFILTAIGLVLSLLIGVLVYTQVAEAQRVRASLPSTVVIVAATDIPDRSEVAASMLTVSTDPYQLIQDGDVTRVADVADQSPDGG